MASSSGVAGPVLVLGAAGFIGGHMLRGLAAAGIPTIAGDLRAMAPPPGVAARRLDARDPAALDAALREAAAVITCLRAPPARLVEATQRLVQAAGCRRIVHLSDMAVYGDATGLVWESTPLTPIDPPGEALAASESILRAHAEAGGAVVVLRAGCVHGPGAGEWTLRPARLLRAGRLGDLGPAGQGVCNLTPVRDLVAAAIAALRLPGPRGQVFNIADPEPGRWNDYFLALGHAIGLRPRAIGPRQLMIERLAAAPLLALEGLGRHTGLGLPAALPPALLRRFGQNITLDHRRADAVLAIPRTPPGQALAEAAQWLRAGAGDL